MTVPWVQHAFNGGEVGADFLGRSDHARYEAACAVLENFVCQPIGPATRRPGTRFVAPAKYPDRPVRLLRFEFNVEQAYILEVGHRYLRVFLPAGRLEDPPGTPVEIVTPYLDTELDDVKTAQDADVLWMAHPNHPVQRLIRYSATIWRLEPLTLRPPPSVEGLTDLGVSLTLSATTGLAATALAATPVFVTADIDRVIVLKPSATLIGGGAATITSLVGATIPATTVTITILEPFPQTSLPAGSWALTGSPVADCTPNRSQPVGGRITLSLSRITGSSPNFARNGSFSAGTADWTDTSTGTGTFTVSGGVAILNAGTGSGVGSCQQASLTTLVPAQYEVQFDVGSAPLSVMVGTTAGGGEVYAEQSFAIGTESTFNFTLETSATIYIQFRNNQQTAATLDNVRFLQGSSDGWRAGDVGKYVKIRQGVAQLTAITNAALAQGVILAPLTSEDTAKAGTWSLEEAAWSPVRGYPRALAFHQQRLWFAGTKAQPQTIWGSVVGQYQNFATGVADTASVEYTMATNEMSVIDWLVPYRHLFIGTKGGEHVLRASSGILTPTNVEQEPQTTFGSSGLAPVRSHSILFHVQRGGRLIWELTFDDTFSARPRDLRLWSPEMTQAGIQALAFQRAPRAIVWAVRTDGQLIGLTYDFFEQIQGWHRHTTLGTFVAVATMPIEPSSDEQTEQVWVAVRRTVQGAAVTYIEVLDPTLYVDSGLKYSGSPVTQLAGAGHLEGWTVAVQGDGADYGPHLVTGGMVALAHEVREAQLGLPMVSRLDPLPPEAGLRDGALVGRRKRWAWVNVTLQGSATLEMNGHPVALRTGEDTQDTGVPVQTLTARASTLGWSREAGLTLIARAPLPCTIVRLRGDLEVEDYA